MPAPAETSKLARGMGRLIPHTSNGPWTWQAWNGRRKKWTTTSTNEVNRAKAEQFAFQQMAIRDGSTFRAHGVEILFLTVADEYITAREHGHNCKRLRPSSMLKFTGAITAFKKFTGDGYDTLGVDQVDGTFLRQFVDHEAKRTSAESTNRSLGFIQQILKFAFEHHYILRIPEVAGACEPTGNSLDEHDDGIEG